MSENIAESGAKLLTSILLVLVSSCHLAKAQVPIGYKEVLVGEISGFDRGKGSKESLWFQNGGVVASPDRRHAAAVTARGGKFLMWVDGREDDAVLQILTAPLFSSDGSHVAYVAQFDKTAVSVVVDGKRGKSFTRIGQVVFSSDGGRVGYDAYRKNEAFAVIDGQEFGPFEGVSTPVFSPDSKQFAFSTSGKKQSADNLMVGGKRVGMSFPLRMVHSELRPFAFVQPSGEAVFGRGRNSVAYLDDQLRLQFAAEGAGQDSKIQAKECIGLPNYAFSQDGLHVACVVPHTVGKKLFHKVLMDDRPIGTYEDWVMDMQFSPNGNRLAFLVKKGTFSPKTSAVVDGQVYEVNRHTDIVFSPDSSRFAWIDVGPKGKVFVDGAEFVVERPPDMSAQIFACAIAGNRVVFSPDSKRVGFSGNCGFGVVWIDGKPGRKFTRLGPPIFSPDSRQFAYMATDNDRFILVVDGKERQIDGDCIINLNDPTSWGVWDSDGLRYMVNRGGKIIQVVERLAPTTE